LLKPAPLLPIVSLGQKHWRRPGSFILPTAIDNAIFMITGVRPEQGRAGVAQKAGSAFGEAASEGSPGRVPDYAELIKPVEKINTKMRAYGLEFDLARSAGRVVTRLIDVDSGEVIRQIPSETVLHIAERLDDAAGMLVREEA